MSLTPSEVFTLRPALRHAKGTVLVGGLGLGWLAQQIRLKKGVTRVIIAERDPDIARVLGSPLLDLPGAPVDIRVGDFYRIARESMQTLTSIVCDIWKDFNDAPYDREFQALKEEFSGKVWGWGDYDQPFSYR